MAVGAAHARLLLSKEHAAVLMSLHSETLLPCGEVQPESFGPRRRRQPARMKRAAERLSIAGPIKVLL
jgi:hypothetical protein